MLGIKSSRLFWQIASFLTPRFNALDSTNCRGNELSPHFTWERTAVNSLNKTVYFMSPSHYILFLVSLFDFPTY